jgi:hypothetical protein
MTDSISLSELLRLATKRLDSQFIGSLLSLVFELQLGASKTKMLNLILSEGLSEYLFDGEFLEALGEGKLRSSHLVKYVFFKSNRFSVVSTQVKFLLNAERLNIFNRSTLKELHKGMGVWQDLDTQSLFWFELMQELDTYLKVGQFTIKLLETLPHVDHKMVTRALEKVLSYDDFGGEADDLKQQLVDYPDILSSLNEFEPSDDSSIDSHGNLRDFVVDEEESSSDDTIDRSQNRKRKRVESSSSES